jgi:Rrf2 family protein
MFSRTCEYAIRAMIFITQKSKQQEKTGIKALAKGINAPEHFIAKIMQNLVKHELVQSSKGPNGGFYLTRESLNTSIADIVKAVDGDSIFTQCGLGLRECSEKRPCPIHHSFKPIREQIAKMLHKARLYNFEENNELTFLKITDTP